MTVTRILLLFQLYPVLRQFRPTNQDWTESAPTRPYQSNSRNYSTSSRSFFVQTKNGSELKFYFFFILEKKAISILPFRKFKDFFHHASYFINSPYMVNFINWTVILLSYRLEISFNFQAKVRNKIPHFSIRIKSVRKIIHLLPFWKVKEIINATENSPSFRNIINLRKESGGWRRGNTVIRTCVLLEGSVLVVACRDCSTVRTQSGTNINIFRHEVHI